MTDAEFAADRFHERQDRWPGSKFKPPKGVVREHDPALPKVIFYRFRDGSVARLDQATGDLIA
jgi:hypothetical protein